MGIEVKYADGRRLVVDDKNVKREYNKEGNLVIRRYKAPESLKKRSAKGQKYVSKEELNKQGRQIATRVEAVKRQAEKANASKQAVAEAVLRSLAASDERIRQVAIDQARARERSIRSSLTQTVGGRNLQRILTRTQLNKLGTSTSPLSNEYRAKIMSQVEYLRPKIIVNNSKYKPVVVDGVAFIPKSQREANYLSKLKRLIARDEKLKSDYNAALKNSGLVVNRGDKWYLKAYKGAGGLGIGLLFTGAFLANASEKLAFTIAGLGASKRIRSAVAKESFRTAKTTPKVVAQSLDPTKPENWANILFTVGTIIYVAGKIKPTTNIKTIKNTKTNLNKSLVKVQKAKKAALKNPRKNSAIIKKLKAAENNIKKKQSYVSQAEKLAIKQRAYAKKIAKLDKGLQVKAKRPIMQTINGKKVYGFTDPFTGKVRYFNSFKQWRKAVVNSEKLISKGLKTSSSRAVKAQARKASLALEKQRRILRAEQAASKKAPRTLTKKQRQATKLALRRGSIKTSAKDITRAQRSLKWVVSKDIRIGKFAKGVVVDLVEKNGKIKAVVVNDKGALTIVKKTGNNLKPVAKISAKTTSKGFEVKTGNGQVILLQEAKTISKKPVVKTATRVVVKVKTGTVAKAKRYYALLLKQSRKGTTISKAKSIGSLGNIFFPLFLGGKISKSIVTDISASKFKTPTKIRSVVASKTSQVAKNKAASLQAEKIVSKLAVATATSLKPAFVEKLISKLIEVRRRLPKRFKLKLPKRKKPDARKRKVLDELYSKIDKKYRPSLAAILFGIYGYRPKVITGINLRPLLKKNRRK